MAMIAAERQLEEALITKLRDLKYEYRPDIRDRATLEQNFREKFEALTARSVGGAGLRHGTAMPSPPQRMASRSASGLAASTSPMRSTSSRRTVRRRECWAKKPRSHRSAMPRLSG